MEYLRQMIQLLLPPDHKSTNFPERKSLSSLLISLGSKKLRNNKWWDESQYNLLSKHREKQNSRYRIVSIVHHVTFVKWNVTMCCCRYFTELCWWKVSGKEKGLFRTFLYSQSVLWTGILDPGVMIICRFEKEVSVLNEVKSFQWHGAMSSTTVMNLHWPI